MSRDKAIHGRNEIRKPVDVQIVEESQKGNLEQVIEEFGDATNFPNSG